MLQEYDSIPESLSPRTAFVLRAIDRGNEYYQARTDRNIGWIMDHEQQMLRTMVVAIAGTGGMGGLAAQAMLRLGIGEIRIADPESFDLSNVNRQFAAGVHTIGCSKAIETARMLRSISDDSRIVVYQEGVAADMVDEFLDGADVVIDEIEFWSVAPCILLHHAARKRNIPVFNCLTVGFATYLHLFTSESASVETMLGLRKEEALALEEKLHADSLSDIERLDLATRILHCFIPSLPQYYSGAEKHARNAYVLERLTTQGIASIIATNPLVASGIVANQVLLFLLAKNGVERSIPAMPVTPGYLFFDSARFETKVVLNRGQEE